MNAGSICVYCGSRGPFTDEHVLARAFAGPGEDWTLDDLVCGRCNKLFSKYERAWTSAPGEAMARIHWGPAGRKRKGVAYQAHPSENIFLLIKDDPVPYEADILRGLEPRIRPQMISAKDKLFAVAGAAGDAARLTKATNDFWQKREVTIQKRPDPGPQQFRIATLALDDQFRFERIELRAEPAGAWLDRFPTGLTTGNDPRMSVDPRGRLRFRVTKLRELTELLNRALREPCVAAPGGRSEPSDLQLAVRSIYDTDKVPRAIAKTLVNFLVDALGAEYVGNKTFRPILDYCLGRIGDRRKAPFVGRIELPTGVPAVDRCPPERHVLALSSNGSLVVGLLRLYGGAVHRVHLGRAPPASPRFMEAVWIDYNGVGRVPVTP